MNSSLESGLHPATNDLWLVFGTRVVLDGLSRSSVSAAVITGPRMHLHSVHPHVMDREFNGLGVDVHWSAGDGQGDWWCTMLTDLALQADIHPALMRGLSAVDVSLMNDRDDVFGRGRHGTVHRGIACAA